MESFLECPDGRSEDERVIKYSEDQVWDVVRKACKSLKLLKVVLGGLSLHCIMRKEHPSYTKFEHYMRPRFC
jgi:hypothetical protein